MIAPKWPAPHNVTALTLLPDESIDWPKPPFRLKQVHGNQVAILPSVLKQIEADAAITCTPRTVCLIQTADCLPLLITNKTGNEVAAIHAGWRGLAKGIIQETLAQMQSTPSSLLVWLAPSISQCAYEVGEEVKNAFGHAFEQAFVASSKQNHYFANLADIAKITLAHLGVSPVHITESGLCTHHDTRFASYRRDHNTRKRQLNLIWFD